MRGNKLDCFQVQSDWCLLFNANLLCDLVSWRSDEGLNEKAVS